MHHALDVEVALRRARGPEHDDLAAPRVRRFGIRFADREHRIGQAELSYDIPVTSVTGEKVRDDIKVTFTTDLNQAAAVNPYVMNFAEKANAHRLVTRVLDEYKRTGKATTRLAPNVTRVLDDETGSARERAPDPVGRRERVAARDPSVATPGGDADQVWGLEEFVG